MISLVVVIIVLLILGGIGFYSSQGSVNNASKSEFFQEVSIIEESVASKRLFNQTKGIGEEFENGGFSKIKLENPPVEFVSFNEDDYCGYVVDLEYLELLSEVKRGRDYPKYINSEGSMVAAFDRDDIYIYDKTGKVFYVKGFMCEDGIYYTNGEFSKAGPEIVSISKILSTDEKNVTVRIVTRKKNGGNVSAFLDENEMTKVMSDGDEDTFEYKVYENKTYKIKAVETNKGTSMSKVEVTEINALTYLVEFDANGGVNPPFPQVKTENVPLKITKDAPIRGGYIFLGWDKNPLAEIPTYRADSEFILNENILLYAIWKVDDGKSFNVIYNLNGGENGPEAENNLAGEYSISETIPHRDGYGFEGWSEEERAKTATYFPGNTISIDRNLILYAVWTKGTQTLLLSVVPEGAGTVIGNGSKLAGGEVYISTTPAQGSTFVNWTVKRGNVSLANATASSTTFTMPDEEVEIVANYVTDHLEVRYNSNKGSAISRKDTVRYGESVNITTLVPRREGYDFVGWSTRQDGNTPKYYAAGETYEVFENTTFYAVWQIHAETYVITYNLNGGYGNRRGDPEGIFVEQIKAKGAGIQIYVGGAEEPYREGFAFKGWSLSPDSDQIAINPGDIYRQDNNLDLYAVWKDEMKPTINITTEQKADLSGIEIVASAMDNGEIVEYAWTMNEILPTSWERVTTAGSEVEIKKEATEKGQNTVWFKDATGNYESASIMIYEIRFDGKDGVGTPAPVLKGENLKIKLPANILTKNRYTFLGWSRKANPVNSASEVDYLPSGEIELNADTTLSAVWGEAFFGMSATTATTQIDGADVSIAITRSEYTGTIHAESQDMQIADVIATNNEIIIKPGIKTGNTRVKVWEENTNYTEWVDVIVNKGLRRIILNETRKSFMYGDSAATVGFSYSGKDSETLVVSTNPSVATARTVGKSLIIQPEGFGTTTIRLTVSEDDQYLANTAELVAEVTKRKIVVTPNANQRKTYDGTATTPTLTYSYTGNKAGEAPGFTGSLQREYGINAGRYLISLGTLALSNNGSFVASNYTLELSETRCYFDIVPIQVTPPTVTLIHEYDGTLKTAVESGTHYTLGNVCQAIDAGSYTATVTLRDTKNTVWSDDQTSHVKIFIWIIKRYDMTKGNISVGAIPNFVYTGNQMRPIPTVTFNGNETLVEGKDFSLEYQQNIDVGTANALIIGKGNFTGTIPQPFNITKATSRLTVSNYQGNFDNADHSISIDVTWPKLGNTIYYSNSELTEANYASGSQTLPLYKNVGTYTVYYYIKNPNCFDQKGSGTVKINPKEFSGSTSITGMVNKKYTGSAITQNITVKDENRTLVLGTDYTVEYQNNINVGTATIIITGKGNYSGTKSDQFNILGDNITFTKSTEAVVASLTLTISKDINITTLEYKVETGEWKPYTSAITIDENCTVYARTMHNGNVIASSSIQITNICEHQFSAATCTKDSRCIYCNEFKEEKLGHDFTTQSPTNSYLKSAATCLTNAVYYYKCSRCTAKGTETYAYGTALGHEYTSKTTTSGYLKSNATCTEPAVYYYKCVRCNDKGTNTYTSGSSLGHDFTVRNMTAAYLKSPATCTAKMTYYYKCSRCDEKGTSTYEYGNVLGHDFTSKTMTGAYIKTPATCTNNAVYYYKCTRCDEEGTGTYSHDGSVLGHSFTVQSQTATYLKDAATCTTNEVYYYKCSRCNEKGTTTWTRSNSALGHTGGTATCTEKARCTRCDNLYGEVLGHNYSEATCIKLATCSRCGGTTGSLADHNFSLTWIKDANYHWNKCTLCSATTNKATHTGGTATCTELKKCSTCNESYGTALGHDMRNISKAATCTEAGYSYKECSRCHLITDRVDTSALGHSYGQATCTTPSTCSRCNGTTGSALGHNFGSYVTVKAATCSETGIKRRTCQRSGCSEIENATIPTISHKWGSWITVTVAKCKTSGVEKRSCTLCSQEERRASAQNPNNHQGPIEETKTADATCTTGAQYTKTCSACGVVTGTRTDTNLLSHNYSTATCVKLATCTRCGARTGSYAAHSYSTTWTSNSSSHWKKCTRSGCTATTSSASHTFGAWTTTKEPKCTETGNRRRTCTTCNYAANASIAIDPNAHPGAELYQDPNGSISATCTREGQARYTCGACGATVIRSTGGALGHTGGTATCLAAKKCTRCSQTYGSLGDHKYKTVSKQATCTADGYTYKECTVCGNITSRSDFTRLGHTGGTATCTSGKKCTRCSVVYQNALGHSWSSSWSTDSEKHWKKCIRSGCTATTNSANHSGGTATCTKKKVCSTCGTSYGSTAAHSFTVQDSSSTYLRTEGTCTGLATYYYKCATCTAKGTTFWKRGGTDLGHTGGTATCTSGKKCTRCGVSYGSSLGHSYAAATCVLASKCTRCGATTGSALGHSYSPSWSTNTTRHWKACTRSGCSVITSNGNHSGGSATCLNKPSCSTCGTSYGSSLGHSYATAWSSNGSTHWKPCMRSGCSSKINSASHSGGTATCTAAKRCTTCLTSYGSSLGHNYASATCTSARKCSRCGGTTGSALGHSYGMATCTSARKCTRCGGTTGSALGHNYSNATCTRARTCTRCGATSGSALGHSYGMATCTSARRCSRCGGTTGSALGHNYSNATCTRARTCTRCGATSGSSLGHSYGSATCTSARRCSRCGATSGSALGHSYTRTCCKNGKKCSRCGVRNHSTCRR